MSTYYISSSLGNDLNNGLSENTAWKTLENISKISGGDTVKLKCGDTFFGSIAVPDCNTTQCQTCITSYGDGEKPIISLYKTALLWQAHTENIWKLDLTDKNSFSGNPSLNTNVGFIFAENEIKPCKKFEMSQLENNWDFYNDDRFVYLYLSEKPSGDIQLACDGTAITLGDNCRVENLEICGSGGHGITAGHPPHDLSVRNAVIDNCYIHHIGGSELKTFRNPCVRYGNGIELWQGGHGFTIENCVICNVYDVAFTMQGTPVDVGWSNVNFRNNILYGNEQSFEVWTNTKDAGEIRNCRFENNICIGAGKGWSHAVRPDKAVGVHLLMYGLKCQKHEINISNNVFYDAKVSLYYNSENNPAEIPKEYHSDRNFIFLSDKTPIIGGKTPIYPKNIAAFALLSGNEKNSHFEICNEPCHISKKLIDDLKKYI